MFEKFIGVCEVEYRARREECRCSVFFSAEINTESTVGSRKCFLHDSSERVLIYQ